MPRSVDPLEIGPAVGHTTTDSMTLWGRARDAGSLCVVELRNSNNDATHRAVMPFKNFEDWDLTIAIVIDGIREELNLERAARSIDYRIGSVPFGFGDVVTQDLDWSDIPWHTTKLAPVDEETPTGFMFGSCRHLDMGWVFDSKKDDRCFEQLIIRAENEADWPLDFVLQVGDQVYVDHPLRSIYSLSRRRLKSEKTYRRHYHRAWCRKKFAETLSRWPNYMIWDDHEIFNNWDIGKVEENKNGWQRPAYENGRKFFRAFQAALNPKTGSDHFFFDYSCGPADYFVLDVRGCRYTKEQLLGAEQQDAVERWFNERPGRPKFVVTAIPFMPDVMPMPRRPLFSYIPAGPDDKWDAFPEERGWLLDRIADFHRMSPGVPVVFLSGDVHCSYGAELVQEDGTPASIYQLVSSGFNWPVPGLNRGHFYIGAPLNASGDWQGKLRTQFIGGEDKVITSHNYCHVKVGAEEIRAEWFSEHGSFLHSVAIPLA